jgi:hypothetical protein
VSSGAVVLAALGAIGLVIWYSMLQVCRPRAVLTVAVGEAWPVPVR